MSLIYDAIWLLFYIKNNTQHECSYRRPNVEDEGEYQENYFQISAPSVFESANLGPQWLTWIN